MEELWKEVLYNLYTSEGLYRKYNIPVLDFHWGHGVLISLLLTVKKKRKTTKIFLNFQACTWCASLVTLAFGIFKSRVFAEILFGISECDAQLELQERHYVKIRKKSNYWIFFLILMIGNVFRSLFRFSIINPILHRGDTKCPLN